MSLVINLDTGEAFDAVVSGSGGGGGGAVDSVNGMTGAVVLTGSDIHVSSSDATTIASSISSLDTSIAGKADSATTLSGYGITDAYTKTEVDSTLSGYATSSDLSNYLTVSTASSTYLTISSASSTYLTISDASSTYLTTSTASSTYATITTVNGKADSATTLSGYGITDAYTKTEVDALIASIESGGSVDLSDYLTKTEASSTYATVSDLSSYLTTATASSTYLTIADASSTYATTSSLSSYATTASLSSYLTTSAASSTYATISSLSSYALSSALPSSDELMSGTAPTVADIDSTSVTDVESLITELNAILAQLRTRGVIA